MCAKSYSMKQKNIVSSEFTMSLVSSAECLFRTASMHVLLENVANSLNGVSFGKAFYLQQLVSHASFLVV